MKTKAHRSEFEDISEVAVGLSTDVFFQQVAVLVGVEPLFLLVPAVLVSAGKGRLVEEGAGVGLALQHHPARLVPHFQPVQSGQCDPNGWVLGGHFLKSSLEANESEEEGFLEEAGVNGEARLGGGNISFSMGLEKVRSRLEFCRMGALMRVSSLSMFHQMKLIIILTIR